MKILRQRQSGVTTNYYLFFQDKNMEPGCGSAFPCDEAGNVYPLEHEAGRSNYARCLRGEGVLPGVIEARENQWTECAVGKCDDCGRRVTLYGFTNTCDCGADYNSSGQRLAPREQWGEETGEHWSDCIDL